MRWLLRAAAPVLVLLAIWPALALAADEDKGKSDEIAAESQELTLEELFPEKSYFGPSAYGLSFSEDGTYGAYCYRPWRERRHGSDLWIFDVAKGESKRVTSVSVMAEFEADVRKVKEDRVEKARKAGWEDKVDNEEKAEAKKEDAAAKEEDAGTKAEDKDKLRETMERGDWVSEKDADDDKAPRYNGVGIADWSLTGHELIIYSYGDLYRYEVDAGKLTRLTVTSDSERNATYLPDGSGYLYQRGSAVMYVKFGDSTVTELRPKLDQGETMDEYELSPDGNKLVFTTTKQTGESPPPLTVTIVDFEQRFARAQEVPRSVSDEPLTPATWSVYLWNLGDYTAEKHQPVKVYSHDTSGPRDAHIMPDWAPDSSRVVWSVFDQSTARVEILEATVPEEKGEDEDQADADKPKDDGGKAEAKDGEADKKPEEEPRNGEEPRIPKARVLTRFLHNGGPDTVYDIRPWYMPDSRKVILLTEQTGFRHLHVLDPLYEALDPVTSGRYEDYPIGPTRDHKRLFLSADREATECRDLYSLDLTDLTLTRLTPQRGCYHGAVSPDGKHVLANYEHYGVLRELVYVDVGKQEQKPLTDSHSEKAKKLTQPVPTFFTYKNRQGHDIHGEMFVPDDLKPEDKRPLLIYVYGGPLGSGSNSVRDGSYGYDDYFFAYYMTKKHGWVTCVIDPRGQSGYGAVFEKASYEQVGVPQTEDLVDGVNYLVEKGGIDPKRVAVHGWSFGGFQTQMCMYTAPDTFAAGMAGAGPTQWENYNSWYSQGVVGPTRVGEPDLSEFSLVPRAKNLKGRLLLLHGMKDDNVLYQDTVKVYTALLDAGKGPLVDLFLDPSGGHSLGGHIKSLQRFKKYEDFLLRTLGTAQGPPVIPGVTDVQDKAEEKPEGEGKPKEGDAGGQPTRVAPR